MKELLPSRLLQVTDGSFSNPILEVRIDAAESQSLPTAFA